MTAYIRIPTTGGVNLHDDPREIRDDELVKAKNLVPFRKGMLRKRPALRYWQYFDGTFPSGSLIGDVPRAVTLCPSTFDIDGIVASKRGLVSWAPNSEDGPLYQEFGSLAPRAPVLFTLNGTIYCLPGGDNTGAGYKVEAPSTLSAFAFQGTNNGFSPNVAGVYRRRAVYGDFGAGYENRIAFADPDDPTSVANDLRSANTGAIDIGATDSDRIVAFAEITQSEVGAPIDSSLLILKHYSAHILVGEPGTVADPDLTGLSVSKVAFECGCVSASSVVQTPYGIFWVGPDDIWYFERGSLPVRVGTKLRPLLEAQPANLRWRIQAAYHKGFLRVALFSQGQGPTDDSLLGEQWWLDLRKGAPKNSEEACWWGPQVFCPPRAYLDTLTDSYVGTNIFLRDAREKNSEVLYDIRPGAHEGGLGSINSGGYIYDQEASRDFYEDYLSGGSRVTDPNAPENHDEAGCEIEVELISKEYDFGHPMLHKGLIATYSDYWTNLTAQIKQQVLVDGGYSTDDTSEELEAPSLLLDADATENNLARKFQELAIYPSDIVTGKTFQFRIYDQAGYVIGETNDTLVILRNGTYYAVELTHGHYDDLGTLCDHIDAQATAAIGTSVVFSEDEPFSVGGLRTPLGITFGSAVTLCFQSAGGAITSAQLRKCRALMGMLGWDTSANSSSGVTQTATTVVFWKQTAMLEIAAIEVEYDVFPRGPA